MFALGHLRSSQHANCHFVAGTLNQLYQVTIETGADKLQWVGSTYVRIVFGTAPFNFMGPVNVPLDPSSTTQVFTAAVTSNVEVQGPQPRLRMQVYQSGAWVIGFDSWDVAKVTVKHVASGNEWRYGPFRFTESAGELPFISASGPQRSPDTCSAGSALDVGKQLCATCQLGSFCPGGDNAAARLCDAGKTTATSGSTTAADCLALKATGSNAYAIQVITASTQGGEGKDSSTYAAARVTLVGTDGISNPLPLNYQPATCAETSWIDYGVSTYQLSGVGQVGAIQNVVLSLEPKDSCRHGSFWVFDEWQVASVQVTDRTTGAVYICPAHDQWVQGSGNFELKVGCQAAPSSGKHIRFG